MTTKEFLLTAELIKMMTRCITYDPIPQRTPNEQEQTNQQQEHK